MADAALFTIAGQEFKVTSSERVFYPATGTTKLDVIGYYAAASTAMPPHLVGRPATRKRWPEGVKKTSFFVKDLEAGTPGWLTRVQIRHGSGRKTPSRRIRSAAATSPGWPRPEHGRN
jgi:bifunctional non-homologous end joining protein LigD